MMDDKYKIYINDELSLQASSVMASCLEGASDNFVLIRVSDISTSWENGFDAKKGDSISIGYFINDIYVYEFEGDSLSDITQDNNKQNINLVIRTIEMPDLPLIMVLNSWVREHEILNWKKTRAKEMKELWLNSCLYWQGVFPPSGDGIIEATLSIKDVYCYEDFFCMLGESFFGFRGYMGKGFDSFYDCLSELVINNVNVTLKDVERIAHFLKSISPADTDYYDVFINILTENGCVIHY